MKSSTDRRLSLRKCRDKSRTAK